MLAIPDTKILCWDWFCVSITVRCRPKVPTFSCRLGMLPTCPQHSQPRLHGAMRCGRHWPVHGERWQSLLRPDSVHCFVVLWVVVVGCERNIATSVVLWQNGKNKAVLRIVWVATMEICVRYASTRFYRFWLFVYHTGQKPVQNRWPWRPPGQYSTNSCPVVASSGL